MRLPTPALILGACALGAALSVAAAGGLAVGPSRPSTAARSLAAPQVQGLPPPGWLTYAYLGADPWDLRTPPGAVWVYEGQQMGWDQPVTSQMTLSAFAVSSRRMMLAVADGKRRVRVYSLRPPYRELPWRGPQPLPRFHPMLLPTCGTIAAWTKGGIVDGLTGREISSNEYWRPACSADGQVVVGAKTNAPEQLLRGGAALYLGGRRISPATRYYAVSPGGRYVAWVAAGSVLGRLDWPVCVARTGGQGPPQCAPSATDIGWVPYSEASLDSVADDGSLIFAAQNAAYSCPGCRSIYFWTPDSPLNLPVLMVPSGTGPQWITPAAARALIARYKYLRAHRKHAARKGPQDRKKARSPAA